MYPHPLSAIEIGEPSQNVILVKGCDNVPSFIINEWHINIASPDFRSTF